MDLGATVSELSQLLTQAIVLPLRRRRQARSGRGKRRSAAASGGTLVIAGGQPPDELVPEMIRLAGGRRCRAVVLPTGHLEFRAAGERYVRFLTRFGMQSVEVADLVTRQRASDGDRAAAVAQADLILVGGGDGGLLLDVLGGTPAEAALRSAVAGGGVLCFAGGVSCAAGEAALAWRPGVPGVPALRPGLGLLPRCLIDHHGTARGRVGALFLAMSHHGRNGLIGLGIDEDTALVASGGQVEARGEGAAIAVEGAGRRLVVHVLTEGWRLDPASRRVHPPSGPDAVPGPAGPPATGGSHPRTEPGAARRSAADG